tara:strand:+ start:297 stop:1340 length:1044 start_codon:yes stop_codon:yes gene_type:complete
MKYKNNIILNSATITKAIKNLNKLRYKTLVVIDKKKKLYGTLTDGDIRRAILKGHHLQSKIKDITFKKPLKKIIDKYFPKIIKKENVNVIPCVDRFNKVKSIEIYKNTKEKDKSLDKLEVVLMAGGFGKRLMPLTKKIPKPLLKINNKSLLELAMENFNKYGINKFNISIFYKSRFIKNYFKRKKVKKNRISFLEEKRPLGTAGCLSMLDLNKTKDNILVFNGDIITDLNIGNLLKFHNETSSDITVCAKEIFNTSPFGQILFKGSKIKKIIEKAKERSFVNAGIYLIKKKMIEKMHIKKIDMTSFIAKKISEGKNINIYPIYEYWVDIGRKETFKNILKKNRLKIL